ncbi:MAG: ABC transporter ATP-binding protein [Xanthobacteraceae bacterium]
MEDDMLALEGISTSYGAAGLVLEDVSFRVKAGQVVTLLGRNGAGKTTCIRTIIGFLRPKGGRVLFRGKQISGLSSEVIARQGLGLVPQGRRIFPSLTVFENLAVAMRKGSKDDKGISWNPDRAYTIFPRLAERRQQLAGSLSGGEQQMLAIARALMLNPRLLLLDEPSEGLAPAIIADVERTIGVLKQQGLSMILVEHNTSLALSLADTAVVLNSGRVVYNGDVGTLKRDEKFISYHLGVY